MSLIVAKRDGNNIYIVSDTKLTYSSEVRGHTQLKTAAPNEGVIKCIIINECLCISYACDDISEAEKAIKKCRELSHRIDKILEHLLRINIDTKNSIEFVVCISSHPFYKIYEIKNLKQKEVPNGWLGSNKGYNLFQEKIYNLKIRDKENENNLSHLGSAMDEVIKSGKDPSVNGFRISVSNRSGCFEYESYMSTAFPERPIQIKSGQAFAITHGTAQEGGYTFTIFPSKANYNIIALHVLQGHFGILYKTENGGLLKPKIIPDVDEHEFAEITKKKYGISPWGFTSSLQKSYLERGNKCFTLKEFPKAIEYYDLGLKQNETTFLADLYFNKGLSFLNLRNIREALLAFNEAKKINNAFAIRINQVLFGKQRFQ